MIKFKTIHYQQVTSTNTILKELLKKEEAEEGTVILADFQTAGRGRGSNSWIADAGMNLLISILLKPDLNASLHFRLNEFMSLAILDTLREYSVDARIKWPNDIYTAGKKIAGLLIENQLIGDHIQQTVIGLGLNLNQRSFPGSLPDAVSLFQLTGDDTDREKFLILLLQNAANYYRKLPDESSNELHESYLKHVWLLGEETGYTKGNQNFRGVLEDVRPQGEIVIRRQNLTREVFHFGEIKLGV